MLIFRLHLYFEEVSIQIFFLTIFEWCLPSPLRVLSSSCILDTSSFWGFSFFLSFFNFYWDTSSLSDMRFTDPCPQPVACLFIVPTAFPEEQRFSFSPSPFYQYFSFTAFAFRVLAVNFFAYTKAADLPTRFLPDVL